MPERQRAELLMPVSDESAALTFFVEAMKANTATLQQVSKTMQGMQEEQKETLRLVHDTRERVIRIESGNQTQLVSDLVTRVNDLERKEDQRQGANNMAVGAMRNGPFIVSIIVSLVTVIVVLVTTGKL
jgi:signal recognition particle GTPase